MYAVVEIAGQQFKVSEKNKVYVPLLAQEPNSELTFDSVLMAGDENETKIGTPFLDSPKVYAKVLEHVQDEKVFVFKKKRRTGHEKFNGHRQQLTRIEITKIG
ncbi:MAG: 50S ribosomal protein L21 [Ignavibacteria bacterium]|nr:50S ribosomal protein L21 [Ignavibacteria bacterium]